MTQRPRPLTRLARELARLPGIGPKTANRLAFHIVSRAVTDNRSLIAALDEAASSLTTCNRCFVLAEANPCPICADPRRDAEVVCVVEEARDLYALEEAGVFGGLYHVLGGAISPLEGRGPGELTIDELRRRIQRDRPREIILAMNADSEGEATVSWLAQELTPLGVTLKRLAVGLPFGSRVEYVDPVTLKGALEGRRDVEG